MNMRLPICEYGLLFEDIARDIFTLLTPYTTEQQYQEAQDCLVSLRNELQRRMNPFHWPSSTGFHRCVTDCCLEATFRIKHRALLAPKATKAPIEPPKPRVLSPGEVVNNLSELLSHLPKEGLKLPKDTYLGEKR